MLTAAPDARAVKLAAGHRRRPRSGLDGGEDGARLSDRNVLVRACERMTRYPGLAMTLLCGRHRINLYPSGVVTRTLIFSCTGEGKPRKDGTHLRKRNPNTQARVGHTSVLGHVGRHWRTAFVKGLGASQRRLARGRFPDSATAPPSACGPAPRWRSCDPPLELADRSRNQCSARSRLMPHHSQASSIAVVRARWLPALLMPAAAGWRRCRGVSVSRRSCRPDVGS